MRSFSQWWFKADNVHHLFIQQVGNPKGSPVLFLHGGPGSGCSNTCISLFNLDRFHIILMDQRGAGKSTPHGCIKNNTTDLLIDDIERIRKALHIQSWLVIGGSWGATLAIAYAQKYPQRVKRMVLRSVFLGTEEELKQAFITTPKKFYPDIFDYFIAPLSLYEQGDPLNSYYRRILSADRQISFIASCLWHDYERILSVIAPSQQSINNFIKLSESSIKKYVPDRELPKTPRLEAHYFSHKNFLCPDQLFSAVKNIAHIPIQIIQSRYDLLCLPTVSQKLINECFNGSLIYIDGAGHSLSDPNVFISMYSAINTT